jgi:hypothetical protein
MAIPGNTHVNTTSMGWLLVGTMRRDKHKQQNEQSKSFNERFTQPLKDWLAILISMLTLYLMLSGRSH